MDWQIFGHENIKKILAKQLASENLAHAYLFCGPAGVGKKTLGMELAKKILKTENLASHPDFLLLSQEGEITIEKVREFIGRLSLKPFAGKRKVAILDNAENLNLQSSNALLKTLEEAASDTVIILAAGQAGVLPTIVSRCQVFNFSAFTPQQLESYAASKGWQASLEIVTLSFCGIARLYALYEDADFLEAQKKLVEQYSNLRSMHSGERMARLNELALSENLQNDLSVWLKWQTQNLRAQPNEFRRAASLSEAISGLRRNFNKKLVLQQLLFNL